MNEKTIFVVGVFFFVDCFDSDNFVGGWESDGGVGVRADYFRYQYEAKEGHGRREKSEIRTQKPVEIFADDRRPDSHGDDLTETPRIK